MSNAAEFYCHPVGNSAQLCAVILCTLDLVLISLLFYKGIKFIMFNKIIQTPKLISISYIIICISAIMHVLFAVLIMLIGNSKYCSGNGAKILAYILGLMVFFYYVCILQGYLLYLIRLKLSFKNTNQALSKCKYILLITCFIIANVSQTILTSVNVQNIKDDFQEDLNVKITLAVQFVAPLCPTIYVISSIILCVLFFTKTFRMSKSKEIKPGIKFIRLGLAVKYLNCAFVTIITTLIQTTIQVYLLSKVSQTRSSVSPAYWYFIIFSLVDGFINVFFLHLQFKFMKSWYHALCNPFRMEINNILNNNISDVDLTVRYDDTTSSHHSGTTTKSSTIPVGLEPTKTDDLDKHNKTLPNDSDLSNTIQYQGQYYPHYFCRLCPFQSDF